MEILVEMFEEIIDIRYSLGKSHRLTHIIVMSVCGRLNKYIDFDYTNAKEKLANRKQFTLNIDIYFYEDLIRSKKDYALENLSILRKMNRYVNYSKEFEELTFKVIPQIHENDN